MSDTDDPYRAPEANVFEPVQEPAGGSIELTLAGDSHLDIGEVMSEAWEKTKGIKGIVVGGGILLYLAVFVVSLVIAMVADVQQQTLIGALISQLIIMMLIYPFMAGVFLVGLRQSVGLPVQFGMQFSQYGLTFPILAIALLQTLCAMVGFVLLIIPGIYITIALSLAIPLKVEKGLGVIDCLVTSLKIVNKQFLNVAVLAFVAGLISALSFFTIIGWIWAVPWMLMVFAIVYRQLAGVSLEA